MEEVIAHVKQSRLPPTIAIPVKNLFLSKYGEFPRKIIIEPRAKEDGVNAVFHVKSVLDRINNEYNIQNESSIIKRCFHQCSKKYFICEQLMVLSNIDGIMIYIESCKWVTNYTNNSKKFLQPDYLPNRHFLVVDQINLFYLSEYENFIQKFAYDLINDDTLNLLEPKTAHLRLIGKSKDRCGGPGSFYLMGYTYIKKPYINDLSISYGGHDFLNIHRKIVTWLNKKDSSGLVLLHGAPGSGKTNYIRYLLHTITNLTDKHLIYVPQDMINDLTNPRLANLLLNCPNSLLIIEDAEGSLSRSRSSSQSVANLLNLSDGLLSDGMQIKILATFNCPLTSLDSALLRPGRLIAQYCFPSTLDIANARYLAESIGVSNIDQINESICLANIYAMKDEKIDEEQNEITSSHCRKCESNHYPYGGEEE